MPVIERGPYLKILILTIAALVTLTACQAMPRHFKPALEEEGEVYLYLQPLSQEADRLSFNLEAVSAIRSDGLEVPLTLSLTELKGGEMHRQRLLAAGVLPSGAYRGLSFKVKNARVRTEDGVASLQTPESATIIDNPFQVVRKKASLLNLVFKYSESVRGEFSFTPVFSALTPGKPVIGLVGYVSNYASNTVTVFDKQSMQVIGVIATGRGPKGIAFDRVKRLAYVAASDDNAIDVIDIPNGEVVSRITLNTGDSPQELALTPDGKLLMTVNAGTNSVSFVDPFALIETGRVNVGDGPASILLDPSGRRAYVFNTLANTMSVIDVAKRSVITTVSLDSWPSRGQFNSRGDTLYVIHELSSYLSIIDPQTLSITKRRFVGMGMNSIKVDSATDLIYAGKKHDSMLGVYDPFSIISVDSIRTGGAASYMTIDGEGNNLCVVAPGRKELLFVNLVSRKVVGTLDVGEDPYWVALMGER